MISQNHPIRININWVQLIGMPETELRFLGWKKKSVGTRQRMPFPAAGCQWSVANIALSVLSQNERN